MLNDFRPSEQLDTFIQSLGRIQSQIQALMELEKSWSNDLSVEQLQELLTRKRKLINNIQLLISDQKQLENELNQTNQDGFSRQYQTYRDKQISDIRQMLENIISLHQRHEQQLKMRSGKIRDSVAEVQQAITMIKSYQSKADQQGLQIDLAG